ncbi:MAG TPA: hypothetical protein V6D17_23960 [Candidatus Obscuribacterales bacterium]
MNIQEHSNLHGQLIQSASELGKKVEREIHLIGSGVVGGAIKEAKDDPIGTAGKAAAAIGCGALLGIGAVAASPYIAGTAVGIGVLGTGSWLWSTFNTFDARNRMRNAAVQNAILSTWNTGDRATFDRNVGAMQNALGKDALDLSLGMLTGVGAAGGARFLPGMVLKSCPNVGFRYFSQKAIERAFPLQQREFRITSGPQSVAPVYAGKDARVNVRELLGKDKHGAEVLGPEKSLLIAHNGAERISLGELSCDTDAIACCKPEKLPPRLRMKSLIQKAGEVDLQLDSAAAKLRVTAADARHHRPHLAAIRLGGDYKARSMSVTDCIKSYMTRGDGGSQELGLEMKEALKEHDLPEILRVCGSLPFKVKRIIGVGSESIVFELDPLDSNIIFAEEGISPKDVVLKLTNPKYVELGEEHGMREFDALRYGPLMRTASKYIAVLQEKVDVVKDPDNIPANELSSLFRQIRRLAHAFYDGKDGAGQIGYNREGRLVVCDWTAVVPYAMCFRDPALSGLRYGFKPSSME